MRTVTVTEKYRAVQEGKMAKSVFLQQMKRQYPFFISQFDSFDSSVAILKNKGMLFEAKEEVYDKDYYKFSDEGVRRGTDAELEKMGIDSTRPGNISKEDLEKAKETALKNLRKDPLYYLNLISGDSLHVDKHDKPVEYKKGNEKDVFNGMKKAELKEEVSEADAIPTEPGIPGERASNHNRKMALRKIIDVLTKDGHPEKGYKVSNDEALSFIKTYRDEIFDGTIDYNSPEAIWDEYEEGESVDRDDVGEGGNIEHNCANHVMHEKYGHGICLEGKHTLLEDGTVTHYDVFFKEGSKTVENIPVNELNILTSSHHGHKRNKKKNEEVEEQMTDQQMKDIQNYGKADKIVKPFKPGDMWSDDFDYEGMLEAALKIRLNTPLETMEALYSSFEDVNYHSENQHLGRAIDAKKEGDKSDALDNLRNFRKAVKETLVSINEGGDPLRDVEEVMGYNRRGEKEEEPRPSNYTKVSEKKGKDHDGDGDVDSDDYMAAKDKAIKKAMGKEVKEDIVKKNIKHIITKVLEEQTINEAATNQLSKLADDYQDFKGMQVVINDLENIVTDVESFYAKTKDRLQGVMDKVGDVSNAEGLKVGAFIAPAIEAAFRKDLRPVTSKGFTKDLNIPKVRRISQADIDRGYVDESEPKQTVYTPVNEKTK
jgi:hypothetical protein|tara:strand:- start:1936 stop:3900 length:1965 start_codon:yes stop_codon:yes gene_type:complete